jgi:hypothetical protein
MAKIYFLRHQAGGVLHEYPFAEPPTEEQRAAVWKLCFHRHGAEHPKIYTDESGNEFKRPYWPSDDPHALVERELLGASDVPAVPEHALSVANAANTAQFMVTAVGKVE